MFSEEWLRAYQAKQARITRATAPNSSYARYARLPDMIRFDLPPLPTLNVLMRMHWAARRQFERKLGELVAAATFDLPTGAPPYEKARIAVTRHAVRDVDPDGLPAICKLLLDVLQPRSERHPRGLGIIAGDDAAHLDLIVNQQRCKRAEARTAVLIERIQ